MANIFHFRGKACEPEWRIMISIAMAVYNGDKYIEKQLNSIVNQTLTPNEIVITDDSDNDNTYSIIKKIIDNYKNISWNYIKNDSRLGYCKNFFKAIGETTGDIIFLSDQDDIWEIEKIKKMHKCIVNDQSINCLCSKYLYIDKNDKVISNVHEYSNSNKYIKSINSKQYFKIDKYEYFKILAFPGMCFAITNRLKNVLLDFLKLVDIESIKYHDLVISYLAARTNSFYILNECLNKYRMHGENAIGVEDYNSGKKQDRVEWLNTIYDNQKDLLNYENKILNNSNNNDDININVLNKLIKFNFNRINYLSNKDYIKCLQLLKHNDCYLSFKSYIGDLLYILK